MEETATLVHGIPYGLDVRFSGFPSRAIGPPFHGYFPASMADALCLCNKKGKEW